MKNYVLLAIGIVVGLGLPSYAYAFSTEQSSSQIDQNADNLKDPDDQVPAIMSTPHNASDGNGHFAFGPSPVNMPTIQSMDGGSQAFDRAFAHQQSSQ